MDAISNKMRDVRVTARVAIGQDFIAPDLSPVKLIDQELEKGIPGWTDLDVKVPVEDKTNHLPVGRAERDLEEIKWGMTTRKAPGPRKVSVSRTGPSAYYLNAKARANKLAAR